MNNILNAVSYKTLFSQNSVLLSHLRQATGENDAVFKHFYLPVLSSAAEFVCALPLSEQAFCYSGGAFVCCLQTGTLACEYARSRLFFPERAQHERRLLEHQCWFATYACVIFSCVAMLWQKAHLFCEDPDDTYYPLSSEQSTYTWLKTALNPKFQWNSDLLEMSRAVNGALAMRLMPKGLLQKFHPRVVQMLFHAILPEKVAKLGDDYLTEAVRETLLAVLGYENDKQKYSYKSEDESSSSNNILINEEDSEEINVQPKEIVLRNMFHTFASHERFKQLSSLIIRDDQNIRLPVQMLALFGMDKQLCLKQLSQCGVLIDSNDKQYVTLDGGILQYFSNYAEDK